MGSKKVTTFAVPFGNERDFYAKKFIEKTERKVQASTGNCCNNFLKKRASISLKEKRQGQAKNYIKIYNEEFDPGSG